MSLCLCIFGFFTWIKRRYILHSSFCNCVAFRLVWNCCFSLVFTVYKQILFKRLRGRTYSTFGQLLWYTAILWLLRLSDINCIDLWRYAFIALLDPIVLCLFCVGYTRWSRIAGLLLVLLCYCWLLSTFGAMLYCILYISCNCVNIIRIRWESLTVAVVIMYLS